MKNISDVSAESRRAALTPLKMLSAALAVLLLFPFLLLRAADRAIRNF